MAQRVRVTYISRNASGEATGIEIEENLLITAEDKRAYPKGFSEPVSMDLFREPQQFLLEDEVGLWSLPVEDCLEMVLLEVETSR